MASLSTSSGPRGPSPGRPIEQLLVMHCLKEDSVLGREGFSVRAASPGASDRDTLDWAMRLDPYQLPLDMKSGPLLANQAPRRLAMVPGPSGQVALIHTAYLPEDTVGRSHSFISQVLLLPELATIEAVAAWGAPDWQTDEYPRGETKSLPRLDDIPRGPLLDEAALSAFLSGAPAPADQSLARSVFPGRVESNPDARRRWVRAALHGFLLTVDANSPRTRVCILAEPGAVALLVYAIARLLPPQLVGSIPFSTYEPPDTSLRENKVARVIGSYARNGLVPSASDALRRKGYVVDTFRDAYGPDLLIETSFPLEGLLDLAAEGDWAAVDELRDLWSRDPQLAQGATPGSLAEVVRARPLAVALKAGTIGADGLIELRRNRFGEGLLRDPGRRRLVWEAVRRVWSRPGIRAEFSDLLREHLDELLDEIRTLAQSGPAGPWREGWDALRPIVPADRRAGDYVSLLEPAGKGPSAAATAPEDRIAMLREWAQLAPKDAALPARLFWLLRVPDASGFRALAKSGLEPRHVGLAACLALAGPSGRELGPAIMQELADEAFQAILAELAGFSYREAAFDNLRSSPDAIRALIERLLQVRAKVPPVQLEDILSGMRCDESIGQGFWLQEQHLEGLLDRLDSESRLSRRLWAALIARITHENFASGAMAVEMETMAAAREKFPSSMAVEDRDRLDGWTSLRVHFTAPQKDPAPGLSARLRKACEDVGQTRESLTREWFRERVLTASGDLERKRRNETLGLVLLGFYETEDNAWYAARKLANDAPDDEQRRLCETDLQKAILSEESRDRLAANGAGEARGVMGHPPSLRGPSGRGKGDGKDSWARFKPYAGAFVAGCLVTVLLILLLWLPIRGLYESISRSGESRAFAKGDGPDRKTIRDLKTRLERTEKTFGDSRNEFNERINKLNESLEQKGKEIEALKTEVSKRDAKIRSLGELSSSNQKAKELFLGTAQPPVSPPAGPDGTPAAPGGESAKALSQLEEIVHVKGVHKEEIKDVRKLAEKLGTVRPAGNQGQSLAVSARLIAHLGTADVPEAIQGTRAVPDPYRNDFAFLDSGIHSESALVTMSSQSYRSFYRFSVDDDFITWTGAAPSKEKERKTQYAFFSTSPSGDFAVSRLANGTRNPVRIDSNKICQFYFGGDKNVVDMELPINVSDPGTTILAISNGGEKLGALTRWGGESRVQIRSFDSQKPVYSLDLHQVAGEVAQGHVISRMSFDTDTKSCVLSMKDSEMLLLFRLNGAPKAQGGEPPKLEMRLLKERGHVVDWGYNSDGRLLVVGTQHDISLYNLEKAEESPGLYKNIPGRQEKAITSVAFNPGGSYLAVGYEDGIVSIYDLRGRPAEVLRLWHGAPIFKVGFSPDGRVLAVLFQSPEGKANRFGYIRLWITKGW